METAALRVKWAQETSSQKGRVQSTASSRSLNRTSDLLGRERIYPCCLSALAVNVTSALTKSYKSSSSPLQTQPVSRGEYPLPLLSRWTPAGQAGIVRTPRVHCTEAAVSIRKKMQDTDLIGEAQPFFLEVRHPSTHPGTSRKSKCLSGSRNKKWPSPPGSRVPSSSPEVFVDPFLRWRAG